MRLIAITPHPGKLFESIKTAFHAASTRAFSPPGHLPTWALRNNRLVHIADQWVESGGFSMEASRKGLTFRFDPALFSRKEVPAYVANLLQGRLVELLLNHFREEFEFLKVD